MNDLKATVILIRWKKHSNQMEAGPVRLGRVGRDPRFSLALSANSGGSWLGGKPGLRAPQSPVSGPGAQLEALWLRSGTSSAPGEQKRAGPCAVRPGRLQQRQRNGHPGHPGHPRSVPALCGWRLWRRGSWRRPDCTDPRRGREPRRRRGAVTEEELSRF